MGGGQSTAPILTVTVGVPDEHIGAVVGREGTSINEIQRVCGVRAKISGRDDFIPGKDVHPIGLFL